MSESNHTTNITLENAQKQLIEESFERPVLIDFWADWCQPCKSLMPVLEKLAQEYDGLFLLAKVNADELNVIASQFGVRSLPTVVLMKDGQPVDGFSGLKPENEIRTLLDKYLPRPWDIKYQEAVTLLESEEYEQATTVLRQLYMDSSKQANIAIAFAQALTRTKRFDEAKEVLDEIKLVDQDQYFEQVKAELELAREAQKSPEIEALEKALAQDPDDADTAFSLAVQYNQQALRKEALALLYNIISKNLNFKEGEAKKVFLDILAVMGKGDPIAAEYQRKLYTLLY